MAEELRLDPDKNEGGGACSGSVCVLKRPQKYTPPVMPSNHMGLTELAEWEKEEYTCDIYGCREKPEYAFTFTLQNIRFTLILCRNHFKKLATLLADKKIYTVEQLEKWQMEEEEKIDHNTCTDTDIKKKES